VLKDQFWFYRVAVKPNSIAMQDLAQVKGERMQLIESLSTFMSMLGPILQSNPELAPMMFNLLRSALAGFEAASELEGTIDQGIQDFMQAQQQRAQQPPQDDRKAQAATIKAQADMQKVQLQHVASLRKSTPSRRPGRRRLASRHRQTRSVKPSRPTTG
jgi:hypothetical protein